MPSQDRTFLLGVGCQKGGTAWLHRYLAASPSCDPGFRKEYHVWDSVDLESAAHFRSRTAERTRRAADRIERGAKPRPIDLETLRLATFHADPESYFDYFELLLSRPGIALTADITPSYAQLSTRRLAALRDGFERRGIRVAPVFLMREPAERIWSAVRMYQQRQPDRFPGTSEERVLRSYRSPTYESRTRYERTMASLEEVFGRQRVWYGLYETLFDPATLRSLCDFLGIDPPEADLDRRFNASPKDASARLPESTARQVAEHYRSTYDAVAERFGTGLMTRVWPDSRFLTR